MSEKFLAGAENISLTDTGRHCPFGLHSEPAESPSLYRPDPSGPYWVRSYALCCEVLRQPELFGNELGANDGSTRPDAQLQKKIASIYLQEGWTPVPPTFNSDPPRHKGRRRFLVPLLTAKRVVSIAPLVKERSEQLLNSLAGRTEIDFVKEFAKPLPLAVIAELIGLPTTDLPLLQRWSEALIDRAGSMASPQRQVECAHLIAAMQTLVMQQLQHRKKAPRADLLTELARAAAAQGHRIDPLEQLALIIDDLFFTGTALVAAALSHGGLLLAQNAALAAELRNNRSLVPAFVEETLRLSSPVNANHRQVRQDTTLGGIRLAKADILLLQFGAANRDESRFDHAGRVDLRRVAAGKHLAFGLGRHFCIGAVLVRSELTIAFNALLSRWESFSLAQPASALQYEPSVTLNSLRTLPLTLALPAVGAAMPVR